jgi:WD40 repeat protein
VWDAATGQKIAALRDHESQVTSAAFSPDGARIVTAAYDRAVRLWDVVTGREIMSLRDNGAYQEIPFLWRWRYSMTNAAFSPDGARIVAGLNDHAAQLWDAVTGQEIASLRGHKDDVTSIAFSPDSGRIVTASNDRTARLWDATTGQEITSIALDAAVTALAVRDGEFALGDALGRVHVFEIGESLGKKEAASA